MWIIYHTFVIAVTLFPLYVDASLIPPSPIELTFLKTTRLFINGFLNGYISLSYMLLQLVGNVIMTLPFGIMLPLMCRKKNKIFYLGMALLFPLLIEWFQLFLGILTTTMYRTFDVDDILLNFTGIISGYGIYRLAPSKIKNFFRQE